LSEENGFFKGKNHRGNYYDPPQTAYPETRLIEPARVGQSPNQPSRPLLTWRIRRSAPRPGGCSGEWKNFGPGPHFSCLRGRGRGRATVPYVRSRFPTAGVGFASDPIGIVSARFPKAGGTGPSPFAPLSRTKTAFAPRAPNHGTGFGPRADAFPQTWKAILPEAENGLSLRPFAGALRRTWPALGPRTDPEGNHRGPGAWGRPPTPGPTPRPRPIGTTLGRPYLRGPRPPPPHGRPKDRSSPPLFCEAAPSGELAHVRKTGPRLTHNPPPRIPPKKEFQVRPPGRPFRSRREGIEPIRRPAIRGSVSVGGGPGRVFGEGLQKTGLGAGSESPLLDNRFGPRNPLPGTRFPLGQEGGAPLPFAHP